MYLNGIPNLIFLITAIAIQECFCQQSLKAVFNMAGVSGEVEFTPVQGNNAVMVNWNLTQATGSYTWQLNVLFVNYDTTEKCSTTNIGQRHGTAGGTVSTGTSQQTIPELSISGLGTVEGRTVTLQKVGDSTVLVCATLMSTGVPDPYTLISRFDSGIFGNVYFRKSADSEATVIYTDIYYGNTQRTETTYTWMVYSGWQNECMSATSGSVFNPTGTAGSTCSATSHNNCVVGKLSSKVGNLAVGSTKGSARRRYTDLNLPIHGDNSIEGNTLVLLNNAGNMVYCTHITSVPSKYAIGQFSHQGVKGHILFKQNSPIDYTSIEVSLKGLNSIADGYHVHKFPVPQRATKVQATCSGSHVGGHFNPFNIVKSNGPADSVGTNDQYEVGDISGKFGGLAGQDTYNLKITDWNMPLFGPNSIMHRSLVIHSSNGGSRWICTNIQDMYPVKAAIARFTYPFIGHAILRQRTENWRGDTSIFIELNTADGSTTSTNYDWKIGVMKAGSDFNADLPTRCASTWGIFGYVENDTDSEYSQQCSPSDQCRCHNGDLTNKHGQVTIRASDHTAAEHLFTDQFLSLTGPNTIIGRSIVLMNGTQKIACATIYEIRERVARVESWTQGVTGELKFSQSVCFIDEKTKITSKLEMLKGIAGPYHIHTLSIPPNAESCSNAMVSGHFNPFEVDKSKYPAPMMGSHDQYEAGDLSGKFGMVSGDYDNSTNWDSNLDLFGVQSVIGRSVVLHKASDGSRWSCGNLVEDTSMTGGTLYQAKATFDSHVLGYVILSQYMYPDESMSDTSVEVNLWYADGSKPTFSHNWHVHEKSVDGDEQAETERCSSAGAHYNPFKVNLQTGYEECGSLNPLRCEVGDQSSKLGACSIGKEREIFNDVHLPLNGPHSVMGRAFVFHVENRGAQRFACSTLMPIGIPAPLSLSIRTPTAMDRGVIATNIAKGISAQPWEVMVVDTTDIKIGCTALHIYFMGPHAESMKTAGSEMMKSGGTFWDMFNLCPTSGCSGMTSTCIMIVVLVFGRLVLR